VGKNAGIVKLESTDFDVFVSQKHGAIAQVFDKFGMPWLWSPEKLKDYHPELGGCFPLTPFSNRVRDSRFFWRGETLNIESPSVTDQHAVHGDGWLSTWAIEHVSRAQIVLSHTGNLFPFEYKAEQVIKIIGKCLQLSLSITHRGSSPMPYGLGFHPWFYQDADTMLFAPAKKVWLEDDAHLPTELTPIPERWKFNHEASRLPNEPMNNLFMGWQMDEKGEHRARVTYPSRRAMIDIVASSRLDRYILYSNGKEFFCFEPVSHNVDAFNYADLGGLQVLNKGETLTAQMSLVFDRDVGFV